MAIDKTGYFFLGECRGILIFICRPPVYVRSFINIITIQPDIDNDECKMANVTVSCPPSSSCANTPGTYTCSCDGGFAEQGDVCVQGQYGGWWVGNTEISNWLQR